MLKHFINVIAVFSFVSSCLSADENLFTVSPQQMVFASKLSDPLRYIFSHELSLAQRQGALEIWQKMQQEDESFDADDALIALLNVCDGSDSKGGLIFHVE